MIFQLIQCCYAKNLIALNKIEISKSFIYGMYIFLVLHLVFISGNDHRSLNLLSSENTIALNAFSEKIHDFKTGQAFQWYHSKFLIKEVIGNLLLLAPLGAMLMMEGTRSKFKILWIAFLSSLGIETLQFISGIGHADIDDLILNTSGSMIGVWFVQWLEAKKSWQIFDRIFHVAYRRQDFGKKVSSSDI